MAKNCKHCGDEIDPNAECSECKKKLREQCQTCHNEVNHGIIKNQNIHFVGNSNSGNNSVEDDTDAFKCADD